MAHFKSLDYEASPLVDKVVPGRLCTQAYQRALNGDPQALDGGSDRYYQPKQLTVGGSTLLYHMRHTSRQESVLVLNALISTQSVEGSPTLDGSPFSWWSSLHRKSLLLHPLLGHVRMLRSETGFSPTEICLLAGDLLVAAFFPASELEGACIELFQVELPSLVGAVAC